MRERIITIDVTPTKEVYKPYGSDWLDIATAFSMGAITVLLIVLWMLGVVP